MSTGDPLARWAVAAGLVSAAGAVGVSWAAERQSVWPIAALAGLLGWLACRRVLCPFERLRDDLQSMVDGKDRPVSLSGLDTTGLVGDMARAVQRVLEHEHAAQADRMRLVSQMRSMLEHATVGLVITIDRKMVIVSRAFWTMFGYEEHEMLGQPGRMIYPSDEAYAEIGPRVGAAFAERGQFDAEVQMIRKDGSLFWCQVMGRPVDPHNMSAGTMWVLYDISEMRTQREQLEWASSHDSLTGLANRSAFERALDRALRERRSATAVLMLDLDRFKQVNDSGGHAAGDQVLRDIAGLLARRLRQTDLVARLGGDEFAVLLEHCDAAHAVEIAESIRGLVLDYRLPWAGAIHSVGVSIGVMPIPAGEAMTRETLLAAADSACYEAKHGGRNRVCAAQIEPRWISTTSS